MEEKEFDYEEHRNNIEQATKIHDMFYKIRNMIIYFLLYSVLYSFVFCSWITNGLTVFVSLVVVCFVAKVATYLFDEIKFSIRVFINKYRRREKK